MRRARTIFIGDLHGCVREFEKMLGLLEYDPSHDCIFLTGDSFARGPKPAATLDLIGKTGARSVLGNHDYHMMRYLRHRETGMYRGETFAKSSTQTVERMWERRGELRLFLESLPVCIMGRGWTLIHAGVHPEKGALGTDQESAIFMRTHPGPNIPGRPKWYECYNGGTLIVFGHDAQGGLVRKEKDGRPMAIGLDTGCVYGGQLSAFILEEDRILQTPAAKTYYDPITKTTNY